MVTRPAQAVLVAATVMVLSSCGSESSGSGSTSDASPTRTAEAASGSPNEAATPEQTAEPALVVAKGPTCPALPKTAVARELQIPVDQLDSPRSFKPGQKIKIPGMPTVPSVTWSCNVASRPDVGDVRRVQTAVAIWGAPTTVKERDGAFNSFTKAVSSGEQKCTVTEEPTWGPAGLSRYCTRPNVDTPRRFSPGQTAITYDGVFDDVRVACSVTSYPQGEDQVTESGARTLCADALATLTKN